MTKRKPPKELDAIADVVLAYRPKAKSKPARRRKRGGGPGHLTLDGVQVVRLPGITTADPVTSMFQFSGPQNPLVGFVVQNAEFVEGEYGISGDDLAPGVGVLETYAPGYQWTNVTVRRSGYRTMPYPAGTVLA